MRFSQLTKEVDLSKYVEEDIGVDLIKAQYNPDRFKYWMECHRGPDSQVLNMSFSPHYYFLRWLEHGVTEVRSTSYYQLQKGYGRAHDWIIKKMRRFADLFADITINGFIDQIIILKEPLVENPYNKGYEIFEGHHRAACCLVLGYRKIPCRVIQ